MIFNSLGRFPLGVAKTNLLLELVINGATSSSSSDNLPMVSVYILLVNNSVEAVLSDNLTLQNINILTLQNVLDEISSGNLTLQNVNILFISDTDLEEFSTNLNLHSILIGTNRQFILDDLYILNNFNSNLFINIKKEKDLVATQSKEVF